MYKSLVFGDEFLAQGLIGLQRGGTFFEIPRKFPKFLEKFQFPKFLES